MKSVSEHFLIIILLSFTFLGLLFAQNKVQQTRLQTFAEEKRLEWNTNKSAAEQFAREQGLPIRQVFPDGTIIEIIKIVNGVPRYYITENAGAATTTRADQLWPGGSLGLNLTGLGYSKLGEWDGGGVLTTHQELFGRVTQMDSPSGLSDHSTHVAGTMIATGVDAAARGMAYQATLQAYEWTNDLSEMASAAAGGMEISNHSYGYISGWFTPDGLNWTWYGDLTVSTTEEYNFGFYGSEARDWDQVAFDAPNYLIVKSSGNDRGDTHNGRHGHYNVAGNYFDSHDTDGGSSGYDCISYMGVAKNILTVGAVAEVQNYTGPGDVGMASFSGWGPTDDGRIKPDIVAKGINLYSSMAGAVDEYDFYSGTSMATPNTAGTLVLLQQHYQNTHSGSPMRSATLKALIVNTADECGTDPGPDYQYGWGLLNAEKAAQLISEDLDQTVIDELTLNNSDTYTRVVTVTGDTPQPLRATIVWTDPPGTPVTAQLDPTDIMLVNDLNITITGSSTTWYPWKLNLASPNAPATNSGLNNVDNVEHIDIDTPAAGDYTITVNHIGSLTNGSQNFSLIVSGIDNFTSIPGNCPADMTTPGNGATDVSLISAIEWSPVSDASSYDLYFGTDGGGITSPSNIENGLNLSTNAYAPELAPGTTYYVQVYPRNNQGANVTCSDIWSFSTAVEQIVTTYPYTENFDEFSIVGSGNDWQNSPEDNFDWSITSGGTLSDGTGPTSDHTSGSGNYLYTESSTPNYPYQNAWLLTPYFDLSQLTNPSMEIWYHMFSTEADTPPEMGDLHIDIFAFGDWITDVALIEGNQEDQWHPLTIDLSPFITSTFIQIRFRGITGSLWRSDMAIDDFMIYPQAMKTFPGGSGDIHSFPNTDVTIQFSTPNSGDLTLSVTKQNSDPGIFGSLPTGIGHISPERYWQVDILSGSVDGIYSITIDLQTMAGISDYSTLKLVKRTNSTSPWEEVGSNAYPGSGTAVVWNNISEGFSQFGIGGAEDNSLPVTLTHFKASLDRSGVMLRWQTESELENLGYIIQRREKAEENWTKIASYQSDEKLLGQGSTSEVTNYIYRDTFIKAGLTYEYQLADVSYAGEIVYHKILEIEVEELNKPESYILGDAYPNPFNPSTIISWQLPVDSYVEISIYNILGEKVTTLVSEKMSEGYYQQEWDASDYSSGIYYYRITADNFHAVKKVILLH
jgi:hypothetical protein